MATESVTVPKPLIPPLRFAAVHPLIYRGSYPRRINYRFLRRYKLKTIISLTPNPVTPETDKELYGFAQQENIKLIHIEVGKGGKGKKRGVPLSKEIALKIIQTMLELENVPLYIHCLNGGHVTSLVVACFRRLLCWTQVSIIGELIAYSQTITVADRSFVETFGGELRVKENYMLTKCNNLTNHIIYNNPYLKIRHVKSDEEKENSSGDSDAEISKNKDKTVSDGKKVNAKEIN